MLRYFTDTQISIQTANTTELTRRVFFRIPNMAPHEVLILWNLNSNPIFNEFSNTEIFHSQPCRFTYIQAGIQTATTSIFRHINLIFPIFFMALKLANNSKMHTCVLFEIWTQSEWLDPPLHCSYFLLFLYVTPDIKSEGRLPITRTGFTKK